MEKFLTKPDVFPMYKACKDSKDQGGFNDSHFFSLASTKSLHPSIKIFGAHDQRRPTSTPRWNSSLLNIPRPRSLDSPRYLDPLGGVVRVKSGNSKKKFLRQLATRPGHATST